MWLEGRQVVWIVVLQIFFLVGCGKAYHAASPQGKQDSPSQLPNPAPSPAPPQDLSAPVVTISAPAENTSASAGVTISGACETGLVVNIAGSGIVQTPAQLCANGNYSANVVFTAGDGGKAVGVAQTDAAGNTGRFERGFIRNSSGATLTLDMPALTITNSASVTLGGRCQGSAQVMVTGAGAAAAVNAGCTNNVYSASVNFSAGDGNKVLNVSQVALNGVTANVNRTFVRDTVAPAVAILQPAANTMAAAGVTVSGSCESGLMVNLSGDITAATAACANSAFSAAVTFSGSDGNKNVMIAQTDQAGNSASASRMFVKAAPNLDGAALYTQNCSGCHGALATSAKRGKTAAQISGAIAAQPAMAFLSTLTSAQINAIASALAITAPPVAACTDTMQLLAPQVKRLTIPQLANSLRAVFGNIITDAQLPNLSDANPRLGFANDPDHLQINEVNIQPLYDAALAMTATVISQNATVAACVTGTSTTCFTDILNSFGPRLWRRPLTATEVTTFTTGLTSVVNAGGTRTDRMNLVLKGLILSPHHLYRSELGDSATPPTAPFNLNQFEIASLLAFTVWDSPPDDALIARAAAGQLLDKTVVKTEAARMMQDARFRQKMADFSIDLLKMKDILTVSKDASFNITANERSTLLQSARSTLENMYPTPAADFMAPFSTEYFHTNATIARYFNGLGSASTALTSTQANPTQRHGILSHPAFLTSIAGEVSSGIVRRGVFTLEQLLCHHLGSPPANISPVPTLPPGWNPDVVTSREVLRVTHSSQAACIGCHQKIDPAGWGFENYGPFGAWRTTEKVNVQINSSGPLSGATAEPLQFQNSLDYVRAITQSPEFQSCMNKKYFKYVSGESFETTAGQCEARNFEYQRSLKGRSLQALIESYIDLASFSRRKPAP